MCHGEQLIERAIKVRLMYSAVIGEERRGAVNHSNRTLLSLLCYYKGKRNKENLMSYFALWTVEEQSK